MKVACVLLCLVFLSGCTDPSESQIRTDFQARHPGCTVKSAVAGEGGVDDVWMDIEFTCPGSQATRAESALYLRKDGNWVYKPT